MQADMEQRPLWWVNPKYKLPADEEPVYLVIASGKVKKNITLEKAVELAWYDSNFGEGESPWTLCQYPEAKGVKILAWAKINIPKEYEDNH